MLCLDDFRRRIIPDPRYTEEERERVYRCLVLVADFLTSSGINVIIDATAHRRRWREIARMSIDRYLEVYVRCPLEICVERESKREGGEVMADLYRKAIERRDMGVDHAGLGEVVGVDVPYEASDHALVIDSHVLDPARSAEIIMDAMKRVGFLV